MTDRDVPKSFGVEATEFSGGLPVVAGFRFGRLGVGRWWMQRDDGELEGEGTEISEDALRGALTRLFEETM